MIFSLSRFLIILLLFASSCNLANKVSIPEKIKDLGLEGQYQKAIIYLYALNLYTGEEYVYKYNEDLFKVDSTLLVGCRLGLSELEIKNDTTLLFFKVDDNKDKASLNYEKPYFSSIGLINDSLRMVGSGSNIYFGIGSDEKEQNFLKEYLSKTSYPIDEQLIELARMNNLL